MTRLPVWLMRAADDASPFSLVTGMRLAGDHRFVDRRRGPRATDAVDRHLLARAHAQAVADRDVVERDFLVAAVVLARAARSWARGRAAPDRAARSLARAQLQHLAEQHQHGDDGGGLEIDRDRAVRAAEGGGKDARRERRDDAVDPGDAGPHRDQREHVEVAGDAATASRARRTASRPTARPASPARAGSSSTCAGAEPGAEAERSARPSPARRPAPPAPAPIQKRRVMSTSSGFGPVVGGDHHRLQRHAADRAGARADLPDLRMHRAGVDRALGTGSGGPLRRRDISPGRRRTSSRQPAQQK